MKKNSTVKQSPKRAKVLARGPITIGLDLGDKSSRYCVLDENGASASGRQRGDHEERAWPGSLGA